MNTPSNSTRHIAFSPPFIEDDEIAAVAQTLKSGWLTSGPVVQKFASAFSNYKKKPATMVQSCTAALHLALLAAGIGKGDQVITTALTFPATVNAILYTGAQPVLVDILFPSLNIDPVQIKKKINPNVKAIIVVHFAGQICDMTAICKLCFQHGLILIEDCAHALESYQNGIASGCFGDYGCFSFYATKNITCGEGGSIITADTKKISLLQSLANHGRNHNAWQLHKPDTTTSSYDICLLGYKYNMSDILATLGLKQLEKVEERYLHRKHLWQIYCQELCNLPLRLPNVTDFDVDNRHALHLFIVGVERPACPLTRDQLAAALYKQQISTSIHYLSIPEYSYYQKKLDVQAQQYPMAKRASTTNLSLPLSAAHSETDILRVCQVLKSLLS